MTMCAGVLLVRVLFLVLFSVALSSGSFCDKGPPGRYCFKDLSGWYECIVDNKTQNMTEKKHLCPVNTRCQCFYGPSCPDSVKDPCGKYELPPPFPGVFSAFYIQVVTTCGPQGCSNVTYTGEILQNATARKLRHDKVESFWETQFVFPFNFIADKKYIQFDTFWTGENCTLAFRAAFPSLEVPPYFTCNELQIPEQENAPFMLCLWQSGGHNPSEEVTTQRWLLQQLPDGRYAPYIHEVHVVSSASSKSSVLYDTNYRAFFADLFDPVQLTLPEFCGRALETFNDNVDF